MRVRVPAWLRAPAAEADPGFAALLTQQTRLGMRLAAWLGIVGVTLFVGLQVLAGQQMALTYGDRTGAVVVVSDEIVVGALCLLLLALSRRDAWVRRAGRGTLGAVLVVSSAAIAVDDVARGDIAFTVAWLALVLLVGVSTVPFQPRHALWMWTLLAGIFAALLATIPVEVGTELYARPVAYLALMGVILISISARLYASRHAQYLALREAEALREQLAEQERRRIADDLHDSLASQVGALALRLEQIARKTARTDVGDDTATLARRTRALMVDLRDTIWVVDALDDTAEGLRERIEMAARELLPDARLRVATAGEPPEGTLPAPLRRTAFLVVREALHNASRHARPANVRIRVDWQPDVLRLAVADDGAGFEPAAPGRGRGLPSMARRVGEAGGAFRVESEPGRGTRVEFSLPRVPAPGVVAPMAAAYTRER